MFEELIPELQGPATALFQAAGSAGLLPRVTSTIRGRSEQARLYRRFQAGLAKYPVAPPGTSAHEFGYAFDMVCTPLEALQDVGYTWQTWGGVWGPGDEVHFEYPGFVVPVPTESLKPSWWEDIAAGLPIAFWPSTLFTLLGIPNIARKTVNPEQEAYLRQLALNLPH